MTRLGYGEYEKYDERDRHLKIGDSNSKERVVLDDQWLYNRFTVEEMGNQLSQVKQITIRNIVAGELYIDGKSLEVDSDLQMCFSNCEFLQRVTLTNLKLKSLNSNQSKIYLLFYNNVEVQNITINDTTFYHGVQCLNLQVVDLKIDKSSFYPSETDNVAGWTFLLRQNSKVENFSVNHKCKFGSIDFQESNIKNLSFKDSHFNIDYAGSKEPNNFQQKSLIIQANTEISDFILNNIELEGLYIKQESIIRSMKILDSSIDYSHISTLNKEEININNIKKNKEFSFHDRTLDNFLATIRNITTSKITFLNFENYGKLTLENIKNNSQATDSNSALIFNTSDLGETKFFGCDFQNGWEVQCKNSRILKTELIGTQFPEKIEDYSVIPTNEEQPSESKEYKNLVLRDFFNQLNTIYSGSSDQINARNYRSHALRLSRKVLWIQINQVIQQLRQKNLSFTNLLISLWQKIVDLILLSLGDWINYFGNDFSRSFIITLFLVPILFLIYTLSLGFRPNFTWDGVCLFFNLLSYVFEFLNPLHKPDFLAKDFQIEVTPFSRFLNGLFRLINIYLIYQFVRSSRKFASN
jgi:hypothetical protein